MEAEDINYSAFPDTIGAQIIDDHCAAGTCVHSTGVSHVDFFLVRNDLATAVVGTSTRMDACVSPHRPTMLTLPYGLQQLTKKVPMRVTKLPVVRPFGPSPCPPDWGAARGKAEQALQVALSASGQHAERTI